MTGYYLSEKTNDDLQSLIKERLRPPFTGAPTGGGSRQVCFVQITAQPVSDLDPYPAKAVYAYADGSWEIYNDAVLVWDVNGINLVTDAYYLATRTGDDPDGNPVYLVNAPVISTGCGLGIDENGNVALDYSIFGCGFEVSSASSGSACPMVLVKAGCGLELDDECAVAIDTSSASKMVIEIPGVAELSMDSCTVTLVTAVTPYTFTFNDCGVVVGISQGETTEIESIIDVGSCCCSSSSSSSSSSSGSSVSSVSSGSSSGSGSSGSSSSGSGPECEYVWNGTTWVHTVDAPPGCNCPPPPFNGSSSGQVFITPASCQSSLVGFAMFAPLTTLEQRLAEAKRIRDALDPPKDCGCKK